MFYVQLDENTPTFTRPADAKAIFGVDKPDSYTDYGNGKTTGSQHSHTQAYQTDNHKTVEIELPSSMSINRVPRHTFENVAETSELMEKYFGGEGFTDEEFLTGLRQGVSRLVRGILRFVLHRTGHRSL